MAAVSRTAPPDKNSNSQAFRRRSLVSLSPVFDFSEKRPKRLDDGWLDDPNLGLCASFEQIWVEKVDKYLLLLILSRIYPLRGHRLANNLHGHPTSILQTTKSGHLLTSKQSNQ